MVDIIYIFFTDPQSNKYFVFWFRFAINIQTGPNLQPRDDIVLHISAIFAEGVLSRASFQNGMWGPEERDGHLPFSPGQPFEMIVLCDTSSYKVTKVSHKNNNTKIVVLTNFTTLMFADCYQWPTLHWIHPSRPISPGNSLGCRRRDWCQQYQLGRWQQHSRRVRLSCPNFRRHVPTSRRCWWSASLSHQPLTYSPLLRSSVRASSTPWRRTLWRPTLSALWRPTRRCTLRGPSARLRRTRLRATSRPSRCCPVWTATLWRSCTLWATTWLWTTRIWTAWLWTAAGIWSTWLSTTSTRL